MKRPQLKPRGGGSYFSAPSTDVQFVSSGCELFNCVLGGGWPLGRVANIVGDKCLSGDTIVSAQRGSFSRARKMDMRTLFNRVKGNHWKRDDASETYLVADVGGYAGMVKLLDVVVTGEKVLYEITNSRGHSIKASEDHKFATPEPDGWTCLTDGLRVGSLTRCWRGTRDKPESDRNRKPRSYTDSVPFHPYGLHHVIGGRDYKRILTARLVMEAAINGMSLQEIIRVLRTDPVVAASLQYTDPEQHIHHLDGDCTNDALDNLLLVDPSEHWGIHADEMPQHTKAIDVAEIVSIRKVGRETTFDITMEGPHNFVANGFVVHNSTGKTLLAIEAFANFHRQHPNGLMFYNEAEAAFDKSYAQALGLPVDAIEFKEDCETVEELFEDLSAKCDLLGKRPGLYVLDSLDALTDKAEKDRKIDEGSYGASKARQLSQLFRRLVRKVKLSRMLVIVISQTRDNIGVTFGAKYSRSGGKALDFYASQVVYLAQVATLRKTINKQQRAIGVTIKAKCTKNKVGLPQRECQFDIKFGYGVDDVAASLTWLGDVDGLTPLGLNSAKVPGYIKRLDSMPLTELAAERQKIDALVRSRWYEIEKHFLPKRGKYA